ncbi:MAG: hypothetical protein ACKVT1_03455 [Dehalococcoidia bacterium]
MDGMIASARLAEAELNMKTNLQREEWATLSRIDRMESALRKARAQLRMTHS